MITTAMDGVKLARTPDRSIAAVAATYAFA
jgi:hypothetical protein